MPTMLFLLKERKEVRRRGEEVMSRTKRQSGIAEARYEAAGVLGILKCFTILRKR